MVNQFGFSLLWPNGNDTEIEEIPETLVNVATWQVNVFDIPGGERLGGGGHRPMGFLSIIDA